MFGPKTGVGGEFMSIEEMARRADPAHRERIHTAQVVVTNASIVFLLIYGSMIYLNPFMTFWKDEAKMKVLTKRIEKAQAEGQRFPTPESSWDKVVFGER